MAHSELNAKTLPPTHTAENRTAADARAETDLRVAAAVKRIRESAQMQHVLTELSKR